MPRWILLIAVAAFLGAADMSLIPPSGSTGVGQSITLAVRVADGASAYAAGQIRVDFDPARLAYVGASLADGGGSLTIHDTPATGTPGRIRALLDRPAAPGGVVMSFTFTALAAGTATAAVMPSHEPFGCRLFNDGLAEIPVTVAGPVAIPIGGAAPSGPTISRAAVAVPGSLVLP